MCLDSPLPCSGISGYHGIYHGTIHVSNNTELGGVLDSDSYSDYSAYFSAGSCDHYNLTRIVSTNHLHYDSGQWWLLPQIVFLWWGLLLVDWNKTCKHSFQVAH